jgi:hypothetical protein
MSAGEVNIHSIPRSKVADAFGHDPAPQSQENTAVKINAHSAFLTEDPSRAFKPYGSDADLGLVEVFGLQTERIHVSLRSTPRWILRQKRRMRIDLDGRVLL